MIECSSLGFEPIVFCFMFRTGTLLIFNRRSSIEREGLIFIQTFTITKRDYQTDLAEIKSNFQNAETLNLTRKDLLQLPVSARMYFS